MGFEGDETFYYWLACSAYYTGRTQFARSVWKKMQEEYPDDARMEPWKERKEKKPVQRPLEERLAAYYISGRKGEKAQLKAVLDSQMAKRRLKISLSGLCFTGKAVQPLIQKTRFLLTELRKRLNKRISQQWNRRPCAFGFFMSFSRSGLTAFS